MNLVLGVAAGVFLGLTAWTYRSEIGWLALFVVGIGIAGYLIFLVVRSTRRAIANPRRISRLIQKIRELKLVSENDLGALEFGLADPLMEDAWKSLEVLVDDHCMEYRLLNNNFERVKNDGLKDSHIVEIRAVVDKVVRHFKTSLR